MPTIFSRIISGELPCHKVAENDKFLAFLDINPLVIGHVLVVPKIEVDYLFDLEDSILSEMVLFSKFVATKLKRVITCRRIGVSVIGLEVPHAHIHLIPINGIGDMNFSQLKLNPSSDELAQLASLIQNA